MLCRIRLTIYYLLNFKAFFDYTFYYTKTNGCATISYYILISAAKSEIFTFLLNYTCSLFLSNIYLQTEK